MWTNLTNNELKINWHPNHFVCLLPVNKDLLNREFELDINQENLELNQSFEDLSLKK